MNKLIHEEESDAILGAGFESYNEKGCGFLEAVSQESLGIEFEVQSVPARPLVPIPLTDKGRSLKKSYGADFFCYERVLVELKAVSSLIDEHRAQVQNHLRATGLKVGLLVNFGHFPNGEHERFVG